MYESCKTPIRVAYLGFALVGIGSFIQNPNVNIFYTFRSTFILFIAELFLNIGKFVIMNLPLIFMLNVVCKKEHNAAPVVIALVGYFTFLVTTMLFANQSLSSQAYATGYGINSAFNLASGNRYPLETGMVGALIVAYSTRAAFIFSRHRGTFSLTNIFEKDTAGIVYNILICFGLGISVSYGYPFIYQYIQKTITFISSDLLDPVRIGIYSVLDRVLSILGLGSIIRYPFWFTSLGGSFQNTLTGQSILGDVPIFAFIKENNVNYLGAGRFVTPYYIINMFIIPAFYIGTLFCVSDKEDRKSLIFLFFAAILMSVIIGNPLPVELLMLFTSPILLVFYLLLVGAVSYGLIAFKAFMGFEASGNNIVAALPGTFPDFIINLRNVNYASTISIMLMIGVTAFVIMLIGVIVYYRFIAFDFANTGAGDKLVNKLIEAIGKNNITRAESGLFRLNIDLINPDIIDVEKIKKVCPRNVTETKNGLRLALGTSSYSIARRIKKELRIKTK